MTSMVAGLEREGWVERVRDEKDGRAVLVSLTKAGEKIVRDNQRARAEALALQLAELSSTDLAKVRRILPILDLLIDAIDDDF